MHRMISYLIFVLIWGGLIFMKSAMGDNVSLDPTFYGGHIFTDLSIDSTKLTSDIPHDSALQPDGKIIVIGEALHNYDYDQMDFVVVRYNPDGTLDSGFGVGGIVRTDFFARPDLAQSVVIQDDGKILVGGYCTRPETGSDFAIVRYNPDGSLDTNFGSGGKITTDFTPSNFASTNDVIINLFIQPNGKIVAGGKLNNIYIALARYNRSGNLDSTFGDGGKVSYFEFSTGVSTLAQQTDGKLIAAISLGGPDLILNRFTVDGKVDESFGTAGRATITFDPQRPSYSTAIAIQNDEKIVVAGFGMAPIGESRSTDILLARFHRDGSIDQSFGTGGKVRQFIPLTDTRANAVKIQPDGKILLGGFSFRLASSCEHIQNILTSRFNVDGSLDATFGYQGNILQDLSYIEESADSLLLQPDGKIIIVGDCHRQLGNKDFVLCRYATNGLVDANFGVGGKRSISIGCGGDPVKGFVTQPDGKIVVATTSVDVHEPNRVDDFVLTRFTPAGEVDQSFGVGGIARADFGNDTDIVQSMTVQPDGKILVVGNTLKIGSPSHIAIARFTPSGNLDESFGNQGLVVLSVSNLGDAAMAVAVQPDQKIIIGGIFATGFIQTRTIFDFLILRLQPNGSTDSSFGNNGITTVDFANENDVVTGVAIQPDGKAVLCGYTTVQVINGTIIDDFAAARFNTNGTIDQSFGGAGKVRTDFSQGDDSANGLTLQPDGKIFLFGSADSSMALARYNPNGSLDQNFGNLGRAKPDLHTYGGVAQCAALQADGKIIVGGAATHQQGTDFVVTRLDTAGSLDKSFGNKGIVLIDFNGQSDIARDLEIQADGKLLIVGDANPPSTFGSDIGLARYDDLNKSDICQTPLITRAILDGKRLTVQGSNFDEGAVILVNGKEQVTGPDSTGSPTTLVAKKGGKKIKPAIPATVQVRNYCGTISSGFTVLRN